MSKSSADRHRRTYLSLDSWPCHRGYAIAAISTNVGSRNRARRSGLVCPGQVGGPSPLLGRWVHLCDVIRVCGSALDGTLSV